MEEAEKTQVEDKPKPRTVDQLKDVPYSEMTDEEIALLEQDAPQQD